MWKAKSSRYNELLGAGAPLTLPALQQQPEVQYTPEEPTTIAAMLEISPENITQYQRFTIETAITKIDEDTSWYMKRCRTCNRNIEEDRPHWHCHRPGIPVIPNYRW